MEKELSDENPGLQSMELNEIENRILDLDKWRTIFSSQGLEAGKSISEDNNREEENNEETPRSKRQGMLPANILYSIPKELIIASDLGGHPITIAAAMELRKMLFGNTFNTFNYEWKISFFKFKDPFSDLAYCLEAEKGGTRAIQMAVQAHIIKYLLFTRNKDEHRSLQSLREIGQKQQERALAGAMADILWTAGEGGKAKVCLITSDCYVTESTDYKADNFTERIQLFEFMNKEKLEKFIFAHIRCFKNEGSHGVILFLYSLLFSRTFSRLWEDLDFTTTHLLHFNLGNYTPRQAILNMMLTGRASPHLFNGDRMLEESELTPKILHGVQSRSDVGYLHWSREEMEQNKLPQVGSMLKTPKFPIWVCNISSTYSVLFGMKTSLLHDWKMEHIFDLYFYNGQLSQDKTVHLTIDTHSHHWEGKYKSDGSDPEKKFPSLEMTIRTKWDGAAINWNSTVPFF